MKIENIILEGLRTTGTDSVRPNPTSLVLEQQDKEVELGQHQDDDAESAISDNDAEPPAYETRLTRRQSSMIEELTRQASVLWHGDTEADEGGTTTDDDDELVAQNIR